MTDYTVDVTGCQSVISTCRGTMDSKSDHFGFVMNELHLALQSCVGDTTVTGRPESAVKDLEGAGDNLWIDQLQATFTGLTGAITSNINRLEEAVNYYAEGDHIMKMRQQTAGDDTVLYAPEVIQDGQVVHEGGYIHSGVAEVQDNSRSGHELLDGPGKSSTTPFVEAEG